MKTATYGWSVLLAAMALAVIGGAGDAKTGADPAVPAEPTPPLVSAALAGHEMEAVWETNVLVDPGTALRKLWLRGDFLVALGSNNRIYVINAATGVRMYSHVVAPQTETVWPPAAMKDTLYVPTTTTLWAFRGPDGERAGNTLLGFSPSGGAATNGTQVFIPDAKGWLQAVSVSPDNLPWNLWKSGMATASPVLFRGIESVREENGANLVRPQTDVAVRGDAARGWGGESWGRWTEDTMTAAPVVDSTLVYFGGQNGAVYASLQNTRNVVWEYQAEGPIVADLKKTKSGLILAPSLDYSLYAFAGPSGRVVWRYNAGEPLRRAPYTVGKQVFVLTREAGLTALDATNGKAQWSLADGIGVVAGDNDSVFVLARAGDLVAIDRQNGKENFSIPLAPGVLTAPNEGDTGLIYLATPSGQVMAVAKKRDLLELARREAEELAAKEAAAAAAAKKEAAGPEKPAPPPTATVTGAEPATPAVKKEPPPKREPVKKGPPPKKEPPPKRTPPKRG